MADGGVLEDAVVDTVQRLVALVEDVALDKDPLVFSQKAFVVSAGAGQLDETAGPVLEMLEVSGSRASDDTIKVIWEVLGRVQTLLTTS